MLIHRIQKAFFLLGFSLPSLEKTAKLLDFGFASLVSSDNSRINVKGNFEASFVLNLSSFIASALENSFNVSTEDKKHALDVPEKTVEKMTNENTKKSDFDSNKIDLFWNKFGIKVTEDSKGKAEYYYYETPESQPVKLSKQDIANIQGHISNIKSNEDLLNKAIKVGSEINQLMNEMNKNSKSENSNETENEDDFFENFKVNNINHEINHSNKNDPLNETDNSKNNISENNYINEQAEKRKQEEKHHFKVLSEIDNNRKELNSKKFQTWTENLVNKIKDDSKQISEQK